MRRSSVLLASAIAAAALPMTIAATPAGCDDVAGTGTTGDPIYAKGYVNEATSYSTSEALGGPVPGLGYYQDVVAEVAGTVTISAEWSIPSNHDIVIRDKDGNELLRSESSDLGSEVTDFVAPADCFMMRILVANAGGVGFPVQNITFSVSEVR